MKTKFTPHSGSQIRHTHTINNFFLLIDSSVPRILREDLSVKKNTFYVD